MNVKLDINGKIIRSIRITNVHPDIFLSNEQDSCPYMVTDDLTEDTFFLSHSRSDGAAVLAQKALERVIEHEQELKFLFQK